MTAKMTRNILLMLAATVLMGIVLNLYIHNTGTVPAADNAAPPDRWQLHFLCTGLLERGDRHGHRDRRQGDRRTGGRLC